jgi:5,10-methenyltetrahydromethanopterin hydrogenase
VTPEEVLEKHTLNAANEIGDVCRGCLESWPCDAVLVAYWADDARAASAALVASLIAQRDACLDAMK